ncbi:DM13 domain-containing protein [Porticoccaceae bacterium]|nr:DM13 domain-containing protein [Porticoccaceae bacterium]MDA8663873.1 DM13 domain-containing protein [Porticoccaceae bacterium]MDA8681642.1 DM13 domain-containing protein [Porticoccaceae bacterium]MDA8788997.1 DM13 domain-containing protein [Porticoccaceae bacterium]MDB2344260.1 DM13 domain-containing protein [Porticoccaceae bacterium]
MSKFIMLKLMATHTLTLLIGVAAGIYMLPLLTAGDGPDKNILDQVMENRHYSGTFSRDREDSDLLHWGEGELSIGPSRIAFSGRLAPGPDYRLYLSPVFIETERAFIEQKQSMKEVGAINTFDGFLIDIPTRVDAATYTTAIVWCETFDQFITSAVYKTAENN